jgi:CO dehydrogenase maturation factor
MHKKEAGHKKEKTGACVMAVCGKGGVGKTSVSAMIVKLLSENSKNRVLAVDADPAVGLSTALGVRAGKTVDDIRNDLIRRLKKKTAGGKQDILSMLDYEMFSAIREQANIAFLAIGRPETEGCYCQVNQILKDLIASLADHFDYVVIDGEAGVEQVNRRVMKRVDRLILVSDASVKSIYVAETILKVSEAAIDYSRAGLIFNRIRNTEAFTLPVIPPGLEFLGRIPEDETIRSYDICGKSILGMEDTPALRATATCLRTLKIEKQDQAAPLNAWGEIKPVRTAPH